ncbi:MAG: AsmA-like C-terminal region-containing protein [Hyphomicrobiaceae bacterium]
MSETREGTGRDLIVVEPDRKSRSITVARRAPTVVLPTPRKSRARRVSLVVFEGLAGLVLLCGLIAVGFYVALLRGPVPVPFLIAPLESAINTELAGVRVAIGSVILQRGRWGGVRLRLRNVALRDEDGDVVARAPLAAVRLSTEALMHGRIAPKQVDFIEPRLLVSYTPEGGLTLSFGRGADNERPGNGREPPQAAPAAPATAAPARPDEGGGRRIDLAQMLSRASERARSGNDAASFLTSFGLRDAVVVLDRPGQQTAWRVPSMIIQLDHRQKRSIITGKARVMSDGEPWTLVFRAEDSQKQKSLTISLDADGLVPARLAASLDGLAGLRALDSRVKLNMVLTLDRRGDIQATSTRLVLGPGHIRVGKAAGEALAIEGGDVVLRYERAKPGEIQVAESVLSGAWGNVRFAGLVKQVGPDAGVGDWRFDLAAKEGRLAGREPGSPTFAIDRLQLAGRILAATDTLRLETARLEFGGAAFAMTGDVRQLGTSPQLKLSGVVGAMPVKTLAAVWPHALAPGGRDWLRAHVSAGQVLGGRFTIANSPGAAAGRAPSDGGFHISLEIKGEQLVVNYLDGQPPLHLPQVTARLEGAVFELAAPTGTLALGNGRAIRVTDGRFTIADVHQPTSIGEIAFRAQGSADEALDLLDRKPFGYVSGSGLRVTGVTGKVDGTLKLRLPLKLDVRLEDMRMLGRVKVTETRARNILGDFDLQGGSVVFDLTERAIEAKGDLLLQGVSAKLSWQRIFGASPDRQPPLRLSALLDAADRKQLGLEIDHVVIGDIPVELTLRQSATGAPETSVRADLTNTELVLENVAWRKLPGRSAILQFDIAKGTGKGHKVELQGFKIVGEDVAIDGWMALGRNNRLVAFHFPDFSVNVVTRLEVVGRLGADGNWKVKATGQTYDGRDFFRSLFSAGRLSERQRPPTGREPGLDLEAEIGTVIGFSDTTVRKVRMTLVKRKGRLVGLSATGTLETGQPLAARLDKGRNGERLLVAESKDAGSAFRLVGFYPNIKGGHASLQVNLDAKGGAEKSGTLWARQFIILGDQVVSEVVASSDDAATAAPTGQRPLRRRVVRTQFAFDRMKVPFSVGYGQFVLHDSYINGPEIGATMRGKVDFNSRAMTIGGTFVPVYGLNAAFGGIPVIGEILRGRPGEGLFGMTFAVHGSLAQPQVVVHPLSPLAPGIFRQIFEMTPQSPALRPSQPRPATPRRPDRATRSSSSPPGSAGPAILDQGWQARTRAPQD